MRLRGKVRFTVSFCVLTVAVVMAASSWAAAQDSLREFVYTTSFADDTVSGFSLNLRNGEATQVPGSPFATGIGPVSVTHSPDGRFVYVVINSEFLGGPCGSNNGELISYSVDLRTGALTQLDDLVLSGICSSGVAIDPTGKFVYAASFPGTNPKVGIIDGFQTSKGHLTPLPGTPFASTIEVAPGQNPAIQQLVITPDGKVLYASNPNDLRGILIFDRDTPTGALAFRTGVNTGSPFNPIAITPSGRFLLALGGGFISFGQPGVFELAIGEHGDLTPVPGSPFPLPHGFGTSMAISPDGKFVAVAGAFSVITGAGIDAFREHARGRLSLVPGSPFGNFTAGDITFDPSGRFVLVPGIVLRVHPGTGALTQVSQFVGGDTIDVVRICVDSDNEDRNGDGRPDGGCHDQHKDGDRGQD